MRTGRTSIVVVIMLILGMVPCAVASAQSGADNVRRPYRGLFGGPQDPSKPQSLVLTGSLYGAYDDNVLAGLTNSLARNWRLQRSGYYGGAQAGLSYNVARIGRRFSVGAGSAAQVHYYTRGDISQISPYYRGDLSADARLTRSTTLSASQRVAYSPTYRASMVPDAGDAFDADQDSDHDVDPDLELFRLEALRAYTTLALSQSLGRNTSLRGSYRYRYVDFRGDGDGEPGRFRDYQAHSASVAASHQRRLTSHAVLNLGYGVRVSDGGSRTGEPRVFHNINAGVSYSRALSFSRRTSLSFASGSAIAVRERLDISDGGRRTRARLTGNAALTHEIGRTWTAQVSYRRGFVFREDFAEDFYFMDSVTASIGGLVSRRLSASAGGAWATSSLERAGRTRNSRLSAAAQATYGLSRFVGLYARYIYYAVDYGADVPLDPRLSRKLDRQGVRVGLTTSIPLIR